MDASSRPARTGRSAFSWSFAIAVLLVLPASAQVRGISYTVAPAGEYIFFERDSGLEEQLLFGGELGFGFGRLVELNALYTFNNNVLTDYTELTGISEELGSRLVLLDEQQVGIQRYGGVVKVNLGTGNVVPYVEAGTGILRFSPEDRNASRTIYLAGGAGLQLGVADRYTLRFGVQNLSYRYNLGSTFFDAADLAEAGLLPENFPETTVSNWAVRGSLAFYLGGRDPDTVTDLDLALREQLSGGLSGLSIPVEPFYGSVSFDEAFGLRETQRMAGVFAGINLGPYVGVRGFYWRGIEDESTFDLDDLQAYGGEVKFRLGYGSNITPYLLLGGGYLDVLDGYAGPSGAQVEAEDHAFAIAGVGAVVPLGDAVRINAGVRNLLMSTQGVDNVNSPNEVQSNWMYSGGLSFTIGGGGSPTAGSIVEDRLRTLTEEGVTRQEALEVEVDRLQARLDSLVAVQARSVPQRRTLAVGETDTLVAVPGEPASALRTNLSDRTITIPVPEEGEIYLRFGGAVADGAAAGAYGVPTILPDGTVALTTPSGAAPLTDTTMSLGAGLTAAQVERIVAQAVSQQLRQAQLGAPVEAPASAELTALRAEIQSLADRLDDRTAEVDRLRSELDRRTGGGGVTIVERDGEVVRTVDGDVRSGGLFGRRTLQGIYPIVGIRAGQGPEQFLLGLRGDYRSVTGGRLRVMPEVAFGFGDGTSFAFVGNGVLPFAGALAGPSLQPYAGVGAGLVSERGLRGIGLALNLLAGVEYPVGNSIVFAEYSTLDLFDYSRFLFGYRFRF